MGRRPLRRFEQKQTKKLVLVTRLHLDSEEHAVRFFGQYSEALEKKYAERSNLLRRPNFFSFDTPDGGVFLDCLGNECVTMEVPPAKPSTPSPKS